jgi:hypothetical protein
MRHLFALTTAFALFSVFVAKSVLAAPLFSTDTDIFLGQKRGSGRVWTNAYFGDTRLKPVEEDRLHPHFFGLQLGFDAAKSHGIYSTYFFNVNQSKMRFDGDPSTIDN